VLYLSPACKPIPNKRFHNYGYVSLSFFVISLLSGLSGCSDTSLVAPPPQNFGSSLNTTSAEQHPRFSYDGRYLVLASDRQSQRSVWLYDLQTQRPVSLPGLNQRGIVQDEPDISADGRYIVYISEESGKPDVYIYDRQTLQNKNLTKSWLGQVRNPSISGNGRFIAFETNRTGQWDIALYDRGANIEISLPQKR
jgi:Tol biopolymer transport system component